MAGLGHIAVGMAAGRLFEGRPRVRTEAWFAALAMLPDLDVIGFRFGVAYGAPWGHRGASHSFLVAAIAGVICGLGMWKSGKPLRRCLVFCVAVILTHGLLDTLTTGGLGIGLLWPWNLTRFFAPWRPIPVAPIATAMFSARGAYVTLVEAVEFAPFLVYALWPGRARP